jgi:hypothetical protein
MGSRCDEKGKSLSSEADGIDQFRRELLSNLPRLLEKAMSGYSRFAVEPPLENNKGFLAYQTSCRAALAHIHLLVKLAHWARASDGETEQSDESEKLQRLVREAEAALCSEPVETDLADSDDESSF